MKKALPPIIALLLFVVGVGLIVRPDLVALPGSAPTRAVIIHETGVNKPLSPVMVELYAKATSIGVAVWDKNLLGKGRQPSAEAKPFLDKTAGQELPVLVLQWPGGGITVKPCPATFATLKKEVGK